MRILLVWKNSWEAALFPTTIISRNREASKYLQKCTAVYRHHFPVEQSDSVHYVDAVRLFNDADQGLFKDVDDPIILSVLNCKMSTSPHASIAPTSLLQENWTNSWAATYNNCDIWRSSHLNHLQQPPLHGDHLWSLNGAHSACSIPFVPTNLETHLVLSVRRKMDLEQEDALE